MDGCKLKVREGALDAKTLGSEEGALEGKKDGSRDGGLDTGAVLGPLVGPAVGSVVEGLLLGVTMGEVDTGEDDGASVGAFDTGAVVGIWVGSSDFNTVGLKRVAASSSASLSLSDGPRKKISAVLGVGFAVSHGLWCQKVS